MAAPGKISRRVFVIMPFDRGGTRNETQLTTFFQNNIKHPIESAELKHRYEVYRSGQTFDITAEIIRDLCRADIVIADLSGAEPNPNVMYELGVRLAISEKAVILIREKSQANKRIFDIHGFYTHDYDPYDYGALEKHLIDKLARLEGGEEPYTNPVLGIVRSELERASPDLTSVAPERQRELALLGARAVAEAVERAYGPHGVGLAVVTPERGVLLQKQGAAIARDMHSANPFEEAGIRVMSACAAQMAEYGDGTKLPIILARALIDACIESTRRGLDFRDLEPHITAAVKDVTEQVRRIAMVTTAARARAVVDTAAKGPLDVDILAAIEQAGANGIVSIEDAGLGRTSAVETIDHPVFDRGAIHPNFLSQGPGRQRIFDDCNVLVCLAKFTSLAEILPILELGRELGKPLLLVAGDVDGEALAAALLNVERSIIRFVAVKLPGRGQQASGATKDLAILTGATILDPASGHR